MTRRIAPSRTFDGAGCRAAFTIVEIIVVVVIIAIMAGMIMPRMGNLGQRNAENEARAVFALLSSMAQRDAMSSQSYALAYDPENSKVGLLTLVEDGGSGSGGGSSSGGASWVPAPYQIPITLAASELRGVSMDGQQLSGAWTIEVRPGQPRPAISILLGSRDNPDGPAWQVELSPGALAAGMGVLENAGQWTPAGANVQDLDSTGGREQPW